MEQLALICFLLGAGLAARFLLLASEERLRAGLCGTAGVASRPPSAWLCSSRNNTKSPSLSTAFSFGRVEGNGDTTLPLGCCFLRLAVSSLSKRRTDVIQLHPRQLYNCCCPARSILGQLFCWDPSVKHSSGLGVGELFSSSSGVGQLSLASPLESWGCISFVHWLCDF